MNPVLEKGTSYCKASLLAYSVENPQLVIVRDLLCRNAVKTCMKEPCFFQVSLYRFLIYKCDNVICSEIRLPRFLITFSIFFKKETTCFCGFGCNTALYASLIVPCFTWLTCTHSWNMFHNYRYIYSTVLWSYNTRLVFVTFLYCMRCTV